jgi:hypothetical protein
MEEENNTNELGDPKAVTQSQVRKIAAHFIWSKNRTHYLKWELFHHLDKHWSIRFYFVFDHKKEYVGKWVLKHHVDKVYIILTSGEARRYIQYYAKQLEPKEFWSVREGKRYRRSIIDHSTLQSQFILE